MRRNSSLGNVGFSARGGRSRRRHGGSSKLPYLILIGILIVLLGIAAFLWVRRSPAAHVSSVPAATETDSENGVISLDNASAPADDSLEGVIAQAKLLADGYDYDGGGYSVGMDSDFGGKSGIWGIAFGQMHGFSRSRDFNGRITQDSLMGSIYWGRIFRSGERSLWTVKADLTWGMTDNCMESRFSNGMDAHGEWNNRTWLVQAEVSRSIQYAGGWTVSPF